MPLGDYGVLSNRNMVTLNETAGAEVLPVPMLSVSNWGLRLGIGNLHKLVKGVQFFRDRFLKFLDFHFVVAFPKWFMVYLLGVVKVCPRYSLKCGVTRGYAVGGPPAVNPFAFSSMIYEVFRLNSVFSRGLCDISIRA